MAGMMRIQIDDPHEYAKKIREILDYFDMLDQADLDDEPPAGRTVPLDSLRDDVHVPWPGTVGRRDSQGYIRAPGPG